jgi:transposase
VFAIQAADVDTSSTWPDDRDFQNDEATDLTDDEWVWIAPMLPVGAATGRPSSVDLREVLNAIRYRARAGCGWRMLPEDFPG